METIKSFDDIILKHQLNKETLGGIKERLVKRTDSKEFAFTSLQLKAFNHPKFWRGDYDAESTHIIVQGATSSGKTLVSEIAIIDCLKSRKKSIVLVPLKAMVRERWEYFRADLKPQGTNQVYASSSDFQDHDGDIVNGDYEVAVIVYEKFFAMLSQSTNSMLKDCALLVIDELQMLSSIQRGPKLEIAIQKVLRSNKDSGRNDTHTRIMCLTTHDCKVTHIINWLTINEMDCRREPIWIESSKRPTSLKEYVIRTDGTWKMKCTRGEHGEELEKDEDNGKMDVPGYDDNVKTDKAKQILLKELLKKIFQDKPDAKVLIYANGRVRTHKIASFIAGQNILPYERISGNFEEIYKYEGDEYQNLLKENLLPYGIAFHNAALSTALREYIEDLFQKEKRLRMVVATETLTIGMNMPVDVMILFDATVHHGNGIAEGLTSQEYKNFAGRAGRLGQKKSWGESYIFAATETDYDKFWDEYVNCRTEEIESALCGFNKEEALAPYFLSLFKLQQGYSSMAFEELWKESFAYNCTKKSIDMKNLMKELKRASLCQEYFSGDEDEEEDYEPEIELSDFGESMAPYAFTLDTCKKIRRFFFNAGLRRVKKEKKLVWQTEPDAGKGGLPIDITEEDIENDRYLLDILYMLCCTEEVKQSGQLQLPSDKNPDKSREALDKVEKELEKMITASDEKEAMCEVWPNSPLKHMLENGFKHEEADKKCIMRAILLWHWTKGETIKEIARKTGFNSFTAIVSGDLARMAEVVSYQLEAIYHCYGKYKGHTVFKPKALKPLYHLSTRVKYGMSRELVIIANRHMRGLDRKTILNIGELSKKSGRYDSPVNFLNEAPVEELEGVITEQQRRDLIHLIDEIYMRDNLSVILDNIQTYPQGRWQFNTEAYNAIVDLSKSESETEDGNRFAPLEKIFPTDDYLTNNINNDEERFFDIETRVQLIGDYIAKLTLKDKTILLGTYNGETLSAERFNQYIGNNTGYNVLLVKDDGILEDVHYSEESGLWNLTGEAGEVLIQNINLSMTHKVFSGLIAQDIALNDRDASVIVEMLKDTQGVFRSAGLQALRPFLKNYMNNAEQHALVEESNMTVLRILFDNRVVQENRSWGNFLQELEYYGIKCRTLRWGEDLRKESPDDTPILLYLTWDVVKISRNLFEFCQRLRQNHYNNVYAIFESEQSYKQWGTDNPDLPCYELQHCSKIEDYKKIVDSVRLMLKGFRKHEYLIGVSYAHMPEAEGDRPAVIQLRNIIEIINEAFLESVVLFDANPSSKNLFDANGAIPQTLKYYEQCTYYIILDDHYYNTSKNCEKEGKVIQERLNNSLPHHVWFLHPDNDQHCWLYNEETDFSTRLDFSSDNTIEVANGIITEIRKEIRNEF